MSFLTELILFISFIILGLYLPGKFFLTKLRLTKEFPQEFFLSLGIGILLFTLTSYVLSWIKLDNLILPFILLIDFLAIKNKDLLPHLNKNHFKPLLVVLIFALFFSLSMIITGKFGETIIYRQDDLWHLALINELKVNFPPDNPGFSEIPLKGYHFFYNFLAAKISNLFFISPLSIHFHFFPVFTALLWGLGVYSLMFKWSKNISVSLWAVFLTMFGGSFAFILYLQGHTGYSFDSGFGMLQPPGSLFNPPFSLSIVILITALFALYEYINTKQKNWLIPLTLCIGLISMFKVYAGMILIGAFLLFLLYELLKKRFIILIAFAVSAILFFGTYWLFAGGYGYLVFYPLWPPHRILQTYPWYGLDEKIYTYSRLNVIRGLLQTEIDGLNVFLLGNLGTRLIGILILLYTFIKRGVFPSRFALIVVAMAVIAITVPMFFIQSGKVFEIIQMTQYFLFFCALFAAFGFAFFFNLRFPKFLKIVIFIIIIAVTLPSALNDLTDYFDTVKTSKNLSSPYFQTMNYLSKQGNYNSTVLEMPSIETKATDKSIVKWWESSNPGVTAFSNKRSFFNNQYIEFPNTDRKPRVNFIKNLITFNTLYSTSSAYLETREKVIEGLEDYNIKYIFSSYEVLSFSKVDEIKQIYKNPPFVVYKIQN